MSPHFPGTQVQQTSVAENGSRRWTYPVSSVQIEFRCRYIKAKQTKISFVALSTYLYYKCVKHRFYI
jgi:hypothetical protein